MTRSRSAAGRCTAMQHVIGLQCVVCGKRRSPDETDYVRPDHGEEGTLDVCWDYDVIRRPRRLLS